MISGYPSYFNNPSLQGSIRCSVDDRYIKVYTDGGYSLYVFSS